MCSDLYVDSIAVKIRTRATIQTFDGSQPNAIINGIRKSHLLLPIYSEIGKKVVRKITSMLRISVRRFYTSFTLHSFFKKVFFQYCLPERTNLFCLSFKKQQCIVRP